jgi:queuine tRNA-ribosyltransferase
MTTTTTVLRRRLSSLPTPADFPRWAYEPKSYFKFEVIHQSKKSLARVGRIHTPHGTIDTPGFVAVATNAALKAVDFPKADGAGQQLCFANTYHLMLQPGTDIIRDAGGIHKFTGRTDRPFITDSGGFQVFSLKYGSVKESLESQGELKRSTIKNKPHWRSGITGSNAVKVTEDHVIFKSYRDGSQIVLSPESSIQAQKDIGADIIIPLDELPPHHIDRDLLEESVERSHRWEARSLMEHLKDSRERQQAIFCVVHGGTDVELRTKSIEYLTALPWDGYAIGGSLGNGREELRELLDWMMSLLNVGERSSKCRHLLGIADLESVHHAVERGVDTCDSSYPTKLARCGTLMTRNGLIRIKQGKHAHSHSVKIDEDCDCATCTHYDRSYLCHLFKASEPVALQLATVHNIHFMNKLMTRLRQKILNGEI